MRRAGPVLRNGATLGWEFYVYNNVCRCTYTGVHVEARVNLWFCCSGGLSSLLFETVSGSHRDWRLTAEVNRAGQAASSRSLSVSAPPAVRA